MVDPGISREDWWRRNKAALDAKLAADPTLCRACYGFKFTFDEKLMERFNEGEDVDPCFPCEACGGSGKQKNDQQRGKP